jgi:hypothetical protein
MHKRTARTDSFAIDRSMGRIKTDLYIGTRHSRGEVITKWGIVAVTGSETYSRFEFAWKGRHWIMTEYIGRTKRGLAVAATKFARSVVGGRAPRGAE